MVSTSSFSSRTIGGLVDALGSYSHSQLGTLFLTLGIDEPESPYGNKEQRILNCVRHVLSQPRADETITHLIESVLDRWVDGVDPRVMESVTLKEDR